MFADTVSVAHVVRPMRVATMLQALGHEVVFALPEAGRALLRTLDVPSVPVYGMALDRFHRALRLLVPPFDRVGLDLCLADDLRAIDRVRPDAVVRDMRPSVVVAAHLRQVPCVTLLNAYWSPHSPRRLEVSDNVLTRIFGHDLTRASLSHTGAPTMRHVLAPVNAQRAAHGLVPHGGDVFAVFAAGDRTVLLDHPGFVPLAADVAGQCIGPVLWNADEGDAPPTERPFVYVPVGSSGAPSLARAVVRALAASDANVLVAAGRHYDKLADLAGPRVVAARTVDGEAACGAARLVISNGGSPQLWQALEVGTPVFGLPSNIDQALNSRYADRTGAARSLHALRATPRRLREALDAALADRGLCEAAQAQAGRVAALDQPERLRLALHGIL